MKELYVEELAIHNGHESCADDREVVREALDSGYIGWVLSLENAYIRVPTTFRRAEGNIRSIVMRDANELCVILDPIHV